MTRYVAAEYGSDGAWAWWEWDSDPLLMRLTIQDMQQAAHGPVVLLKAEPPSHVQDVESWIDELLDHLPYAPVEGVTVLEAHLPHGWQSFRWHMEAA